MIDNPELGRNIKAPGSKSAGQDCYTRFATVCEAHAELTAIIHGANKFTYAKLIEKSERIARHLHSRNIRSGDMIGVWGGDTPDAIAAHFAVLRLGGIVLAMAQHLPAPEVEDVLTYARPKLVLVDDTLPAGSDEGERRILISALSDTSVPPRMEFPAVSPDDPALVLFSSRKDTVASRFYSHRAILKHVRSGATLPGVGGDAANDTVIDLWRGLLNGDSLVPGAAAAASDMARPVPAFDARAMREIVASVWSEVLGCAPPGGSDTFFGLGGTSVQLLPAQLLLSKRLGRRIDVTVLLETPRLADLAARLAQEQADVPATRLHTSHAFHSRMMDPVTEPLRQMVAGLGLGKPEIPYVSCVNSTWITEMEARDPAYWAAQARATVNFMTGIETVIEGQAPGLLEVGAGGTLSAFAGQTLPRGRHGGIFRSLPDHTQPDTDSVAMAASAGGLWSAGCKLDWSLWRKGDSRRIALPSYPFERRKNWVDAPMPLRRQGAFSETATTPMAAAEQSDGEGLYHRAAI